MTNADGMLLKSCLPAFANADSDRADSLVPHFFQAWLKRRNSETFVCPVSHKIIFLRPEQIFRASGSHCMLKRGKPA